MFIDALLALGLLLSPASQLRPSGSPVGPGELCLVMWLGLTFVRNLIEHNLTISTAPKRILGFWLFFGIALCLGTITAQITGLQNDTTYFKHDVQAYIFVGTISLFCVIDRKAAVRLRRVAWFLVTFGSVMFLMQIGQAESLFVLPGIQPLTWDRLRGWSENPNQLALVCTVIGFVALHLAETAGSRATRLFALACCVLAFYVGILTKSDSFSLVLAFGLPLLVLLKLRKWLNLRDSKPGSRWALATMSIVLLPVVLLLTGPFSFWAAENSETAARQFTERNRDAIERDSVQRFNLWKQAFAIGVSTNLLGLGPGPHLEGIRNAQVTRGKDGDNFRRPNQDPAPDYESHNTLLDLFCQGGVVAVFSFVWLSASTLITMFRARLDGLVLLLCGLGVFSMFHFIVRHPLLWFALSLCLVAGLSQRRRFQLMVRG